MRTVEHILESKAQPFNVIAPDALVIDALKKLDSVNLSYLIVMEDGAYKGVFSEREYSRNVVLKGRNSNTSTVAEVMTTDLPRVQLSDTVEQCMNTMSEARTRYLVAYDGAGAFAGIITIHDLLRQVISDKELVFDSSIAQNLLNHDERGIY
ncbi:CBS domain-containing protein [Pseudocnuella soli]|uniref:CBS domain-containing protein n=1 Tax=Pseudocnuella soli TaxID=2502779 RepID=UPI00104BA5CF|nr:CBS domain-containing protein [Pseudocnuella soli]